MKRREEYLGPEFALRINIDCLRSARLIPNIADIATVAHVSACGADGDDIIGRGDTVSGSIAQGRVEVARSVALERLITHGRVKAAAGVAEERIKTIGRVVVAVVLCKSACYTGGRVVDAGGVAGKGALLRGPCCRRRRYC